MRVSMWQGFSSNHSAGFTIVGVFKSPAEAEAAAARLNGLVRAMADWELGGAPLAPNETWVTEHNGPPSPPEVAMAQELGIAWGDYSLDWVWYDAAGNSAITRLDQYVFIDGGESAMGAHPAEALVVRLGGVPLIDGSIGDASEAHPRYGQIRLHLICRAPSEAVAAEIEAAINTGRSAPPWQSEDEPWRPARFDGTLVRAGRLLAFDEVEFMDLGGTVAALLGYLRAQGCTEIEYRFSEVRSDAQG
jgi:hypothetical protein